MHMHLSSVQNILPTSALLHTVGKLNMDIWVPVRWITRLFRKPYTDRLHTSMISELPLVLHQHVCEAFHIWCRQHCLAIICRSLEHVPRPVSYRQIVLREDVLDRGDRHRVDYCDA